MKDIALEKFHSTTKDFRSVSVKETLQKSIDSSTMTHPDQDVEFKMSCSDRSIFCDPFSIEMAIGSLIDNAVEVREQDRKNRVVVELNVLERDREYISIGIRDDGTGISEEVLKRLYLPGYSSKGGSGMGFFLANKVPEYHGGWIEVKSPSRKWSTEIVLCIPVRKDPVPEYLLARPLGDRLEEGLAREESEHLEISSAPQDLTMFDTKQLRHLEEMAMGDRDFLIRIFEVLTDQLKDTVARIEKCPGIEDMKRVSSIVHRLVGTANGCGALRLAAIAKCMEDRSLGDASLPIDVLLPELEKGIEKVREAAKGLLSYLKGNEK